MSKIPLIGSLRGVVGSTRASWSSRKATLLFCEEGKSFRAMVGTARLDVHAALAMKLWITVQKKGLQAGPRCRDWQWLTLKPLVSYSAFPVDSSLFVILKSIFDTIVYRSPSSTQGDEIYTIYLGNKSWFLFSNAVSSIIYDGFLSTALPSFLFVDYVPTFPKPFSTQLAHYLQRTRRLLFWRFLLSTLLIPRLFLVLQFSLKTLFCSCAFFNTYDGCLVLCQCLSLTCYLCCS